MSNGRWSSSALLSVPGPASSGLVTITVLPAAPAAAGAIPASAMHMTMTARRRTSPTPHCECDHHATLSKRPREHDVLMVRSHDACERDLVAVDG